MARSHWASYLVCLAAVPCLAVNSGTVNSGAIDSIIQGYAERGEFSGTVLVAERNQVVLQKAYGLAERQHNIPNKAETVFRVGSISKQFTAAAILRLHAAGKLSVTDKVSKYLPVPESWGDMTIHHLLTHTGGLPHNGFPNCSDDEMRSNVEACIGLNSEWARYRTVNMLFEFLTGKVPSVESAALGKYRYSNVGYSVLARIVQKVTDEASPGAYGGFMSEMFAHAGLADTAVDHQWTVTPNMASGYMKSGDAWLIAPGLDLSNCAGMGDIRSTANDLFKWHLALEGDRLFTAEEKALLYGKHARHPDSPVMHYGYGWVIADLFGKKFIMHDGDVNGFVANFVRVPEDGLVFIALGNQSNIPTGKIFNDVFRRIYPQFLSQPQIVLPVR